ncbi:MAG: ribonuclease P protein component [Sedimenticolaceae bacterium]
MARLLAAPEFKRVFEHHKRSADAYFTVLAFRDGQGPGRIGLAISKKQVKRAVDRNRLKRLAREVFRHHRSELSGTDLVVMARAAAVAADNARLNESLANLFKRLVTASPR